MAKRPKAQPLYPEKAIHAVLGAYAAQLERPIAPEGSPADERDAAEFAAVAALSEHMVECVRCAERIGRHMSRCAPCDEAFETYLAVEAEAERAARRLARRRAGASGTRPRQLRRSR